MAVEVNSEPQAASIAFKAGAVANVGYPSSGQDIQHS
jgi:hypothetical protein